MPQPVPTRQEVQKIISALLVTCKQATTTGVPLSDLESDYRNEEGMRIPFRELGFSSLIDLLNSLPQHVQLTNRFGVWYVYPVISEKTRHVSSLVAGQKTSIRRNVRGGKRPFRPTPFYPKVYVPPIRLDPKVLAGVIQLVKKAPEGIQINHVLQYTQDRITHSFSYNDLVEQLKEISHEVYVEDNFVYPHGAKSTAQQDQPTTATVPVKNSQNRYTMASTTTAAQQTKCNIRPAGYSSSEEEDHEIPYPIPRPVDSVVEKPETAAPVSSPPPCPAAAASPAPYVVNLSQSAQKLDEDDGVSMLISERTRFRLEKLIQKHPNGIWCAELPALFQKEYSIPLNYEHLGFASVSDFAAHLPNIFNILEPQDNGDRKLFDAKCESPGIKTIPRPQSLTLAALHSIYESYGETVQPVPVMLVSNIFVKGTFTF